ncbi:MAG: YitT family protein [Solobacterium sp.]|nr:YitT family protein [Solobacterium sp.]
MSKTFKQYSELTAGSILLSLGIYLFINPCGINFGGVIGLAQIIKHFISLFFTLPENTDIMGIINLLINIPLFVLAFRIMNTQFCIRTMISILIQTLILSLLPPLKQPVTPDILLNCIFGAMICGTGVGLALRSSACCGGIDIPCMCLVKLHPGFKTGRISIMINAVLFSVCLFIFDVNITMYSIVFVAILYTVADHFHSQNINVAAVIFTDNADMKHVIMEKMGRGVTFWNGYGAYTNHSKEILFCAINKYETSELHNIITGTDPHAFVTFFEGPMIEGGFEKRL